MTLPHVCCPASLPSAAGPAEIPWPLTVTSPEQLPSPRCLLPPHTGRRGRAPAPDGAVLLEAEERHIKSLSAILKEALGTVRQAAASSPCVTISTLPASP